ncbi:MAG: TRAP transporter small permease [Proteobacteria bacterium]|nr:TRAP transporter small permease [Pseudomonadota bacterium]
MGLVSRLRAIVYGAETALLVALLGGMIVIAAYQVIARNLFDTGLLWGDSLVRIMVLWIAVVGALVASRTDDHIRMDVITRFLKPVQIRWLRRFTCLFTSVILGVFAWYSYQFVLFEYQDQAIVFGSVPAWIGEAILPVGMGMMSLRYLLHTFDPP